MNLKNLRMRAFSREFPGWRESELSRRLMAGKEGDDGDDDGGGEGGSDGGGGSMLEGLATQDEGDPGTGDEGGDEARPTSHLMQFGEDGDPGDRPEWVPEQLWDAEKGLDVQKAMKSYGELRNEFNTKVAQAQTLDKGKAPKSADDYLADFKAPESTEERDIGRWGEVKGDDPAVKAWAKVAHRHGLSKERFNAMVGDFLAETNEFLAEPVNMDEEWSKLGGKERGTKLAGAVVADLKAMTGDTANALNEQELAAVLRFGNNADTISAMSKIMAAARGTTPPSIPTGGVQLDGVPSLEEVHAWQGEVVKDGPNQGALRYDVDPAWRSKVDQAWELAAGRGQTRTSSRLPAGGGNA